MTVLSVYAYGVAIGLVVDGDAARTASKIAQAEGSFRIGAACFALVAILDVVVAWGLRVLFAPVSEIGSGLAAAARVAYAAVLLVATGHLVVASQLLTGPEGRAGFTTPELQAQGLLQIDAFNAMWQVGLGLFGFHLLLLAYLVIRSSYVPAVLGILLVPAGLGYLIDSFATILVRDYSLNVAAFTFIGEALLMLWLLARAGASACETIPADKRGETMKTAQHNRPAEAAHVTAAVETMQAIVQDEYGEADDVLRLEPIDRPEIGADEVLVRVHAAGMDRGVWHLMTGLPYPIRIAGYGLRAPKTRVRGREVAGCVEAVGRDVTTVEPGDAVFGIGEGSFAEYACARADKLAPKPERLTFEQAAAVSSPLSPPCRVFATTDAYRRGRRS